MRRRIQPYPWRWLLPALCDNLIRVISAQSRFPLFVVAYSVRTDPRSPTLAIGRRENTRCSPSAIDGALETDALRVEFALVAWANIRLHHERHPRSKGQHLLTSALDDVDLCLRSSNYCRCAKITGPSSSSAKAPALVVSKFRAHHLVGILGERIEELPSGNQLRGHLDAHHARITGLGLFRRIISPPPERI